VALEAGDFLCGGWVWDSLTRELRYYQRAGKGWKEEPEAAERLREVRSLTWHRWSQAPMQSASGQTMPSRLSRIVVEYEGGGNLTLNEDDRDCAGKLAAALAEAAGVTVVEAGAPGPPRTGTVPQPDEQGRLAHRSGRTEVVLDEPVGEIVETRRRLGFATGQSRIPFREVRRLELSYEVKGPLEEFRLTAVHGPQEERTVLAAYQGYEGWALRSEWEEFARELARTIGVEVVSG